MKQEKMPRLSIALTKEELERWKKLSPQKNLSAFIRESVNEYLKIQGPNRKVTVLDLFLEQKELFKKFEESQNQHFEAIEDKLLKLERVQNEIQAELLDLTTALARIELLMPVQKGDRFIWDIKKK